MVVDGNRVEEFDFKSLNKRQLAGNIYLAKVTRVEPSLQAAFVDYGGNRHGFLAFSEIHPDYYQIPKADREALLAEEARAGPRGRGGGRREKPKARGRSRGRKRPQPAAEGAPAAEDAVVVASRSPSINARGRRGSTTCRRRRRPSGEIEIDVPDEPAAADDEAGAESGAGVRDRGGRRRRCRRGARAPRRPKGAALQDPGSDQGPPDPAGPGRQGGARQQGRGADHLSFARRPLLRADAEHRPGRRHLAARSPTPPTARSSRRFPPRSPCRTAPA